MAETTNLDSGLFGIDPYSTPGYLQLPAQPEAVPIPYSPEGWQNSKLVPQAAEGVATVSKPKTGIPGLTGEQMRVLSQLMGGGEQARGLPSAGIPARGGQVQQMAQFTAPSVSKEQTPSRASLARILYGKV